MKPIYKTLLLNVLISIIVVVAFFLTAFLMGYGSNSSYTSATNRLYVVFISTHLIGSILILRKRKILNATNIVITILEVFIIYVLVAWYYNS